MRSLFPSELWISESSEPEGKGRGGALGGMTARGRSKRGFIHSRGVDWGSVAGATRCSATSERGPPARAPLSVGQGAAHAKWGRRGGGVRRCGRAGTVQWRWQGRRL